MVQSDQNQVVFIEDCAFSRPVVGERIMPSRVYETELVKEQQEHQLDG
jgi:hypothetical protein